MLSKIVRPLVETQVRLLANSNSTEKTLAQTVVNWLGYLGVRTEVTQLVPNSGRISVSLTVGKPESCAEDDWQKILRNLSGIQQPNMPSGQSQEREMAKLIQLSRLLAYIIQIGSPNSEVSSEILEKQLAPLNLDSVTIGAVRSALKVPQSVNVIENLDPDLAARVFPLVVKIAWMDNQITSTENDALKALLAQIDPK